MSTIRLLKINLGWQLSLVVPPVLVLVFVDRYYEQAYLSGFVLGAGAYIAANAYFLLLSFRSPMNASSSEAQRQFALASIMRGHRGKLILAALMFALIFSKVQSVEAVAVFGGFIYLTFAQWFIAIRVVSEYTAATNAKLGDKE